MTIRFNHVPNVDSPLNPLIPEKALTNDSWIISSASSWLATILIQVLYIVGKYIL